MDSASASGAQRPDEGLRERMRPSQPVDVNAVDQALATAGYGVTTDSRTSDDKKTFGRTPDGTSKFLFLFLFVLLCFFTCVVVAIKSLR